MESQFDHLDVLEAPALDDRYYVSPITRRAGLSLLHKLVLMARFRPEVILKIRELARNPKELNRRTVKGWTPLMLACRNSRTVSSELVVCILLDAGAQLNLQESAGWTALMLASRYSNEGSTEQTVQLLLDTRKDISLLHSGLVQIFDGVDLNVKDEGNYTALMMAVSNTRTTSTENTVRMLIDGGAELDCQNEDGRTALSLAADEPDSTENTVRMLIEAGAYLNTQDNEGWTPLALAACEPNNSETMVQILIDAGADLNIQDIEGWTPLMLACQEEEDASIVRRLLAAGKEDVKISEGLDLNLRNDESSTALMVACENHNATAIRMLLEAGAILSKDDYIPKCEIVRKPLLAHFRDDHAMVLHLIGSKVPLFTYFITNLLV